MGAPSLARFPPPRHKARSRRPPRQRALRAPQKHAQAPRQRAPRAPQKHARAPNTPRGHKGGPAPGRQPEPQPACRRSSGGACALRNPFTGAGYGAADSKTWKNLIGCGRPRWGAIGPAAGVARCEGTGTEKPKPYVTNPEK